MKKTKIIASLTSLGALAIATPIVATSCSTTQSESFDLYFTNKLSNQIAVGSTAKTYFAAADKNNQSVRLQKVSVTIDAAGINAVADQSYGTGASMLEIIHWVLDITVDPNVKVGTNFTMTINAVDENNQKATFTHKMTVVEHNYELTQIDQTPAVCVDQYCPYKNEQILDQSVSGFIALTDAGNIAFDAIKELVDYDKGEGEWLIDKDLIANGVIKAEIYDKEGNCVVNSTATSGIQIGVYYDYSYQDPHNPVFYQPYFRYTIKAITGLGVIPKVGEYTLNLSVTNLIDVVSISLKFNVVDGMKIDNNENIVTYQKSLFSCYEFTAQIQDIVNSSAIEFTLAPEAERTDTVEYKVTPYGFTKQLPLSMDFGEFEGNENILYIPANALQSKVDTFQFEVTAYVNGKAKANAVFTAVAA